MTHDIRGLEQWEGETREWNKRVGDLKMSAGPGMVGALESWYAAFKKKPTERNRRETLLWRLRLHLKFNHDPEFLQELDEVFEIGLTNEDVGKTMWDITPQQNTSFTNGFNWRRDSGAALRGGRPRSESNDDGEGLEEP